MPLQQISIFLENEPGRLYDVTRALGESGINLRALSLVDTAGFGVLRLLVSDMTKARKVVMQLHLPARVDEVIAVEVGDRPGSLATLLKPLHDALVNVEYMYAFTGFVSDRAVMVFKFGDNERARSILLGNDAKLLDAASFGVLENR